MSRRSWWLVVCALAPLLGGVVSLQAARERLAPSASVTRDTLLYVQQGGTLRRAALSFDTLLADLYWVRTVQHYGSTKLSTDPDKKFDLLYPLVDITTTLDPRFNVAYRYGAIFLSEPFPGGPGRPDLAIALLQKGLAAQPHRWEYAQDIGFVCYWWLKDYASAAEWFKKASEIPNAPNWMAPLAAVTLAQGGSRESSRRLWVEIRNHAEVDWLRRSAEQRLQQLEAIDRIDALRALVERFAHSTGRVPSGWNDLVAAGALAGPPIDPAGFVFQLLPGATGIALDPGSPLNPLPLGPVVAP